MTDDLATVAARYEQVFQMAHLAVEPQLAGAQHAFSFEMRQIVVTLPPLPASDAPPVFARESPFELTASIFMWNAAREPLGVDIGSVKLSMEGLQFSIPSTAATHPHINTSLFTEEQRRDLDHQSDQLYFLAGRAMSYWLRVIWWKTGFHMIDRLAGMTQGGFDGGALINASEGTRFYTPRVGRTVVVPAQPIMRSAQWAEIDSALIAGQEPPVWHDYLMSAHQRMASGDRLAAILDLAVAIEARIRTFLDGELPSGIAKGFRRAVRRQNMSDVLANWRSFGLPEFPDLACIKTIIEIRNGIMHSGKEERASAQFFQTAAEAVARLLAAL